jgi:hypothetical protein
MRLEFIFKAYPTTALYMAHMHADVKNHKRKWKAFLRHSRMSEAEATKVLSPGTSPTVDFEEMDRRTCHLGSTRKWLNKIVIANYLLYAFEEQFRVGNPRTALVDESYSVRKELLEMVILHELSHWKKGGWHGARSYESILIKRQFERDLYGHIVNKRWLCPGPGPSDRFLPGDNMLIDDQF